MAFKSSDDFLKFLTLGAEGVRATAEVLRGEGFQPIELERYCASNKIWSTKIKRLRMPDLLCVKTGIRLEVRAKSNLEVSMSDSPGNPERAWDAGLRKDDLVAFITRVGDGMGGPIFFSVGDMQASIRETKESRRKSQSEGSEMSRIWPTRVPGRDGCVIEVQQGKIKTKLCTGRIQNYGIDGMNAYVQEGFNFRGGASIIAGVMPKLANIKHFLDRKWNSWENLDSRDKVERYASAKAISHIGNPKQHRDALLNRLHNEESENLIKLELAASIARLGENCGIQFIEEFIESEDFSKDLKMEGVLILSELGSEKCLCKIATNRSSAHKELRQAAAWGLGKFGCRSYEKLLELIEDSDDDVVLHSIAAFGSDTDDRVIGKLINKLLSGSRRIQAAASEALRVINSEEVIGLLIEAAKRTNETSPWIIATLGRLPAERVRAACNNSALLKTLEPLLVSSPGESWLACDDSAEKLRHLKRQNIAGLSGDDGIR